MSVEGWREAAFLDPAARRPRRVEGDALLSPFDNAIWFRQRTERMFGVRVRLEIYTPAQKRTHGYYVLPFLQGEAITARVDLKADRKAGVLVVQASHAEPWANDETPARLAAELQRTPSPLSRATSTSRSSTSNAMHAPPGAAADFGSG
ncbi:crosslink repair DNA glycosylase YcaQ family protein [Sorangium sp. So ce269]